MRAEGHPARSICRVLREQVHQIAARTYRAQRNGVIASRTVTDVEVVDAVRATAWVTVADTVGHKRRALNPEGL
jgi:putative transposase